MIRFAKEKRLVDKAGKSKNLGPQKVDFINSRILRLGDATRSDGMSKIQMAKLCQSVHGAYCDYQSLIDNWYAEVTKVVRGSNVCKGLKLTQP